jgi:hypothetical protein
MRLLYAVFVVLVNMHNSTKTNEYLVMTYVNKDSLFYMSRLQVKHAYIKT